MGFLFGSVFWNIIGLGLAIPATATIIINMAIKIKVGDNYELMIAELFKVYLVALIGWSIFFSNMVG